MLKGITRGLMIAALAGVLVGCQEEVKEETSVQEIEQIDLVAGQAPQETVKIFFNTAFSKKLDKAIACLTPDAVIGNRKAVDDLKAIQTVMSLLDEKSWTAEQATEFIGIMKTHLGEKLSPECLALAAEIGKPGFAEATEKFLKLSAVEEFRKELGKAVSGTKLEIVSETVNGNTAEVVAKETIEGRTTTSRYSLVQNADKVWQIAGQVDVKDK